MGDAQRATTFLRVGSYPLQHNTMQDIEEQLLEYADKIAHKYCPVAGMFPNADQGRPSLS